MVAGASGLLNLDRAELNPVASPVCLLLALPAPIRLFDTGSHVAQASLEFPILLPPVSQMAGMYHHMQFVLEVKPSTSMLGKHSFFQLSHTSSLHSSSSLSFCFEAVPPYAAWVGFELQILQVRGAHCDIK